MLLGDALTYNVDPLKSYTSKIIKPYICTCTVLRPFSIRTEPLSCMLAKLWNLSYRFCRFMYTQGRLYRSSILSILVIMQLQRTCVRGPLQQYRACAGISSRGATCTLLHHLAVITQPSLSCFLYFLCIPFSLLQ